MMKYPLLKAGRVIYYEKRKGLVQMKLMGDRQLPLICVPLTGSTNQEIHTQIDAVIQAEPDVIEWRADFFSQLDDHQAVLHMIKQMKEKTDIPILFTIRSVHEGGEVISLKEEEKVQLLVQLCEKTGIDYVDYEASNHEADVIRIREAAHTNDKQIILSYHNFEVTPENGMLIQKALFAEKLGADIVKLAVMPENKSDVYRLLDATQEINEQLRVPLVTMSMGELGALSRVIGWAYGSVLTFGVGVESSAPGQVPVSDLREAIRVNQRILPAWH